jgi:hypothetical protein
MGSRGKRADVRSSHTIRDGMGFVRGAQCRGIAAAGSHGLSCEYGCRNQRGQREGHFGHLFSPYGDGSQGSSTP